ncbi:MAG: aminotransferase class III-fold pyridoxal phosphate-dependent enzyme [Flavobacteriaceae bacterium]
MIPILRKLLFDTYGPLEFKQLAGEVDLNFKATDKNDRHFLIKLIERNKEFSLQESIYKHLDLNVHLLDVNKNYKVYIIPWTQGFVWDELKEPNSAIFQSIGKRAGKLTKQLYNLDHPQKKHLLDWDLAQYKWLEYRIDHLEAEDHQLVKQTLGELKGVKDLYNSLRHSIVHNDLNEHNIILQNQGFDSQISGIIDFGDAIYTQVVNDLAILIAYTTMKLDYPLDGLFQIVKGYNKNFPLTENDLKVLPYLIKLRYCISITKARENAIKNPENDYLQISYSKAKRGLKKWSEIPYKLTYFSALQACGLKDQENLELIAELSQLNLDITDFLPSPIYEISCGLEAPENPIINGYGGYLEPRLFYTTKAFEKISLSKKSYRSIHLGVDFWHEAGTKIKAPLEGEIVICHDNNYEKDYGPTLVLKHQLKSGKTFFTLYGHLTRSSLNHKIGDQIKAGQEFAQIGQSSENGGWQAHLHFQVLTDLLGNTENFPGVAFPQELGIWKSLCPDPLIMFSRQSAPQNSHYGQIKARRSKVLGKNLSLSYENPLLMVRGQGSFLYTSEGQKYLDLVNNVAHVGHENEVVVAAGQKQMSILNTNTRYLHPSVVNYAQALLAKLPDRFTRVYFVNSGSEANELALRIADSERVLALKSGYHGNTNNLVNISSYKFEGKGGRPQASNVELIDFNSPKLKNIDGGGTFIYESILSCAGQIPLDEEFSKSIEPRLKKNGWVSIADEVQTGFGRVGSHFWAFEALGMQPDIITMGKPIGNGHPLGAVACTEELAERFNNGMEFFNTFGGNPVSAEIGLAVLKEIEEKNLQQNALEQGEFLKKALKRIKHPAITDIRGLGLFLGIELNSPELAKFMANQLQKLGVLISTDGPLLNVLKIKPPLIIQRSELEEFVSLFEQVLTKSMSFIE